MFEHDANLAKSANPTDVLARIDPILCSKEANPTDVLA